MMLTQLSKLKAQWKTLPIEWTIKKTDPELEDKVKGLDHSGKVNNTLKKYINRTQEGFGHHDKPHPWIYGHRSDAGS